MKKKFVPMKNRVIRFTDEEWKNLTTYANKTWRGNASHAVRYLVMYGLVNSKGDTNVVN